MRNLIYDWLHGLGEGGVRINHNEHYRTIDIPDLGMGLKNYEYLPIE
jgi:hypothetical protein